MKRDIYSGHMRTGKKKTRYTDAEIAKIKTEAYNKGRAAGGGGSNEGSDGYTAGQLDELTTLEDWLNNAEGRPGKRQVLDRIAQRKGELSQE